MNGFGVIIKILAAAAAIAGAVFVVIVYGEKILGLVKKLLGRVNICVGCEADFVDDSDLESEEVVAGEQDFED